RAAVAVERRQPHQGGAAQPRPSSGRWASSISASTLPSVLSVRSSTAVPPSPPIARRSRVCSARSKGGVTSIVPSQSYPDVTRAPLLLAPRPRHHRGRPHSRQLTRQLGRHELDPAEAGSWLSTAREAARPPASCLMHSSVGVAYSGD